LYSTLIWSMVLCVSFASAPQFYAGYNSFHLPAHEATTRNTRRITAFQIETRLA
jgi:hypothetical protein